MNKKALCCLMLSPLASVATSTIAANNHSDFPTKRPSYTEMRIGAENISYSESLANFANFGKLDLDAKVTNPVLKQSSYSGLLPSWGFYIDTTSTLAPSIDKDVWSLGAFGAVQQNDFKIQVNDIAVKIAYHFDPSIQLTMGGKISSFNFTRSHYEHVSPGAKAFDDALIARGINQPEDHPDHGKRYTLPGQLPQDYGVPLQPLDPRIQKAVSTTEHQFAVNLLAGVKYDSQYIRQGSRLSYFAQAEFSVTAYNQIENTLYESTSFTDFFNGWGVTTKFGARYHLLKNLALVAGVYADYQERSSVQASNSRARVPDVTYSNYSVQAGVYWSY